MAARDAEDFPHEDSPPVTGGSTAARPSGAGIAAAGDVLKGLQAHEAPMSESNADTGKAASGFLPPLENTGGCQPAASEPLTRPAPTVAEPDVSTPAPNAPERGTHAESCAQYDQHQAADCMLDTLPALPPIPGFDMQQRVGRGGMGVVFRAVQLSTGRTVAIKLVNPTGAQDPVSRTRFAREIQTLAALKHPNIVPVYEAGEFYGFPYFAMEYVPGGTLSHHIDRVRADLPAAVRLLVTATRAVAAMHAAGVFHRDLKPLNILLGDGDEPMVADFGLARWADDPSDLTNTGVPVGTRQYMAPEQTPGRRTGYTAACDVWALGVTLYEVLSGSRPFSDDGMTDVYSRIRSEEPPPLASFSPGIPSELEAVIRKCLAKRPDDRYASADALADDLERWLAGKPVFAPPVPAHSPTAPAVLTVPPTNPPRRARVRVASVAAVILVILLAGAGGGLRAPVPPVPKKTLVERVTSGERVKLTDGRGVPTVPCTPTKGHELAESSRDGYHWFSTRRAGVMSLADEAWGCPIRVEADILIVYEPNLGMTGGVYVGRRERQSGELNHESLMWAGVTPRAPVAPANVPLIGCANGLHWWDRDNNNANEIGNESRRPWAADGNVARPRFTHVVVECRETDVRTTVDGTELKPITEAWALTILSLNTRGRQQLPQLTFATPAFGTGIGVFSRHADCAVLNLTVSRIDP